MNGDIPKIGRVEAFLQQDTIYEKCQHLPLDWEVLTFFAATFTVSRSSDFKIGRQDGDGAGEVMHLVPVRGDLQNTGMSMTGRICGGGTSASKRVSGTLFC